MEARYAIGEGVLVENYGGHERRGAVASIVPSIPSDGSGPMYWVDWDNPIDSDALGGAYIRECWISGSLGLHTIRP